MSSSKPMKQEPGVPTIVPKREPSSSSSSSSSASSSASSDERPSKKHKKEAIAPSQKAERKAQERLQKFSSRIRKRLGKFTRSNKKRPVATHAFYVFLLEWINRVAANSEDLKLRRLPTDSRSYRYATNVKKGERILVRLGCEPGANSWIIKDDNLQCLRLAADPLEEECKHVLALINEWHPDPMETPKKLLGKRKASISPYESRAVGAMLGHVCGDILGAPVEGWRPEVIRAWFGLLHEFQNLPHLNDAPGGCGVYTADTELMVITAKSIVKREIFDIKTLAEDLAQGYSEGRPRAYPETMAVLLPRLAQGLDYRKAGSFLNPEGHVHNEGLTRMLPIALTFRNAPAEVLQEAVRGASLFSTIHTTAVSSYYAFTKAVTLLLAQDEVDRFDALRWVEDVFKASECNDVRSRLQLILRDARPLGNGRYRISEETREHLADQMQVEAVEMLATVLCVVCEHWRTPALAVVNAVHAGGETNTLASCVGGMMGALHGHSWIPKKWYRAIENDGDEGRDEIVRTALLLSAYDFFKPGHIKNNSRPIPYKAGLYNYQAILKGEKKYGAKETIYSYG